MNVAALRDHAREISSSSPRTSSEHSPIERRTRRRAGRRRWRGQGHDGGAGAWHGTRRQRGHGRRRWSPRSARCVRASRVCRSPRRRNSARAGSGRTSSASTRPSTRLIAEWVSRFGPAIAQTQERFLAILGHDLASPLGAIIASTRSMLDAGELGGTASRARVARVEQRAAHEPDGARPRGVHAHATRRWRPHGECEVDARRLVHDVVLEIGASSPDSLVQVSTGGDYRAHGTGNGSHRR